MSSSANQVRQEKRAITYFKQRGRDNTEALCRIVAGRLGQGDVEAVVVATTTGFSALKMAETVPEGTCVYAVNFQSAYWDKHSAPEEQTQRKAEKLGVVFMPEEPVAKYLREVAGHSADSLRLLGQGMKVAVEVIMQAVEVGHIQPGAKVIGVGGSSRGADVAIVARAGGPSALEELWVSEILAKVE